MYCKNCGKELMDGIKFCPECGEAIVEEKEFSEFEPEVEIINEETPKVHVPRCFTIFGKIGFGLGLAGFICSFIPLICYVGIELSTIGLVFSILGKRDPELAIKTKKGRIFSILGLSIGFVMSIVSVLLFGDM